MATNDVNLGAVAPQDKEAENAKLREELARLQAKRDNDEASAFGRLKAEAELRKQKETELAEARRKIAELQAANAKSVLSPEELETLGASGVSGVEKVIDAKIAPLMTPASDSVTPLMSRLTALEAEMQKRAAREAYAQQLVGWAAANGAPGLMSRLSPGGDLADKWKAFAAQNPNAVRAYEAGDIETTQAYVKLFVFENPGISQQAATPSAAGGFAPPADSAQYGSNQWLADTAALDERRASGQITQADWAKGYAEANAKLAASQKPR